MISWSQLGIQDKPVFYLRELQDIVVSQEIYGTVEFLFIWKRQSNQGQNLLPDVVQKFTDLIRHTAAMLYWASDVVQKFTDLIRHTAAMLYWASGREKT
ncbi:hypothetical protein SUGI_1019520 [Cryptomeria japonica]|nr:hypothetical protein SUGI_1019520 [Cryptomeria japonica]